MLFGGDWLVEFRQECARGRRGVGVAAKEKEKRDRRENRRTKAQGPGGVLSGPAMSEFYVSAVRTSANPQVVSCLRKKVHPDCSTEQYRITFDRKTCPDCAI